MDALADEPVWVHCIANYRASAFTYLYRINKRGDSKADAKALWIKSGPMNCAMSTPNGRS